MRPRISATGLVILTVSCLFWGRFGGPILIHAYNNDFLCYYIGGTIAREGHFADLYRPVAQIQVQERVAPGVKGPRAYVRPPWFALVLAPLTFLPLVRAYTIWIGVMSTILLSIWAWGAAWFGESALLLAALFLPTNIGLCLGQDCAAMLAVLCVFFILSKRERFFLSGMALAIGLIKPHLLLLFPVWMLLQKRWRMLAGFAAIAATLLATAVLVLGTSGMAAYLDLLLHGTTELGHSPGTMLHIYSLPVNFGIQSRALNAFLAASIVGLAAFRLRSAPTWRAICIASTGSLLISPHVFTYDAALLLLSIWLVLANSTSKPSRYSALVLCAPVTFFFMLANRPFPCIPALALFVFFIALVAETPEHKVSQPDPLG